MMSHIGLKKAPSRSSLSYAISRRPTRRFPESSRSLRLFINAHRPAALFEEFFRILNNHFRSTTGLGHRKAKFRFKNRLFSFDSTTISLCLSLFPWANYRRTKGGVKVHVLLDHNDYMPSFISITDAKRHDNTESKQLDLKPGSIVAVDRGYIDYEQFRRWNDKGVFFVTRMKSNASYDVVEIREVPQKRNIVFDEIIVLTGETTSEKFPGPLRRIVVHDKKKDEDIVLLTNHPSFGSTTISSIYKDRWEIELFFKTLKQNLKVKTFIGTSENALRIQIWTAMIALLVLKWLHYLSKSGWSFSNLASMLRLSLFTYRELRVWLDKPCDTPPLTPDLAQLRLNLS